MTSTYRIKPITTKTGAKGWVVTDADGSRVGKYRSRLNAAQYVLELEYLDTQPCGNLDRTAEKARWEDRMVRA
jgi:hypothetical protein